MKRIKKILIILTLSLYLTAVITPEKEEKAEAVAITGIMALGALAITAVGGTYAYYNSSTVREIGQIAYDKATEAGINVTQMLAQNQFGLNQNLTRKLAESVQEVNGALALNRAGSQELLVHKDSTERIHIPSYFFDNMTDSHFVAIEIGIFGSTKFNRDVLKVGISNRTQTKPYDVRYEPEYVRNDHLGASHTRYVFTSGIIDRNHPYIEFSLPVNANAEPVSVYVSVMKYTSEYERTRTNHMAGVKYLENTESYQGKIDSVYQGSTVSVDYDRIEQIMNNTESEPMTLSNLESIVNGIKVDIGDIGEGVEEQISLSNRILTIVQAIPSLISDMGANTLGGISSLTDDVITGLGNFTDRITAANDRLWEDAGAIWSGMGESLSNVGENVKTFGQSIVGSIENGIDNIRDYTADMKESIGHGIDRVWTGITDLGDRIGTIADDIVTGTTGLVVPSETDMEKVGEKADRLRNTFFSKLDFITVPIKSISGLFLQPKSLYDVTFTMQGVEVHVLPESFRSSVNVLKPVLNGVLVLLTFFGIYKKIQGKEVI